jgi:SAM-dependent methyltransferase
MAEALRSVPVAECPDCGGSVRVRLYFDGTYSVFECAGCRALYTSPKVEFDFQEAYGEDYFRANYLRLEAPSLRYYRKYVIPLLASRLKPGARILEIGSGAGFFLKAAKDAGYRVTGIEPSSFASAYCRERWAVDCRTGFFEDMEPEKFDLVAMFNMLGHLTSDKRAVLEKARSCLNEGGALLAKTTDWNRYYPMVCGRLPHVGLKRACLHLPQQYYYYNSGNIAACLGAGGFRLLHTERCRSEWSLLRALSPRRPKASIAIMLKWILLKAICGPVHTDMLALAVPG